MCQKSELSILRFKAGDLKMPGAVGTSRFQHLAGKDATPSGIDMRAVQFRISGTLNVAAGSGCPQYCLLVDVSATSFRQLLPK
jgi:hypothetical protein